MPRLDASELRQRQDRIRYLGNRVAVEMYLRRVLWSPHPGSRRWYARHDPAQPWTTGYTATSIREYLIEVMLDRLAADGEHDNWYEFHLIRTSKKYEFLRTVQSVWQAYDPPADLPPGPSTRG